MNNNNMNFLDMLTIFSVMLQISNYQSDLKSASNDDLLAELQKQDKVYFEKIIENQKKILSILSQFDDMSADQSSITKNKGRLYVVVLFALNLLKER